MASVDMSRRCLYPPSFPLPCSELKTIGKASQPNTPATEESSGASTLNLHLRQQASVLCLTGTITSPWQPHLPHYPYFSMKNSEALLPPEGAWAFSHTLVEPRRTTVLAWMSPPNIPIREVHPCWKGVSSKFSDDK